MPSLSVIITMKAKILLKILLNYLKVDSNHTTPAIKFLGVFFDPELNFKFHISSLCTKLSKSLYALRTVKNSVNQKSLFLLYNSIFHCHLLYVVHIWSCSSSGPINNLFKHQKSAIKSRFLHFQKWQSQSRTVNNCLSREANPEFSLFRFLC